MDQLNRHMLANEKLCRTAIRHYNDAWLTAERTGEPNPSLAREGRRKRWIATTSLRKPSEARSPTTTYHASKRRCVSSLVE